MRFEVPLSKGLAAVVSLKDFARVNQFKWYAYKHPRSLTYYAARSGPRDEHGHRESILMHRFILGLGPGDPEVDHIDLDGLNNRRTNLRLATHQDNCLNGSERRRTILPRLCPTCGRLFIPTHDRVVTCSEGCRPQNHGPRGQDGRFTSRMCGA